jgi:DNA-binding CsgD family transcriptional regulator
MPRNNSKNDEMLARQQEVSRYRLRGWTQREIAVQLCVSPATINRDIANLEAQWRAHAIESVAEHKARVIAELTEVKRAAWGEHNLHAVLQALKAECDLLGLAAPVKLEQRIEVVDARDKLTQQLDRLTAVSAAGDATEYLN